MTADPADGQSLSGRQAVVRALHVRRYARLAVAFAAVFTLAVAGYFVLGLAGGQTDSPAAYYLALAFVVFVTTAMLALVVLVVRRVLALAVHPAGIVRTSATGGLLAGLLWCVAAVALALGPGQPWATAVDVATPWAPVFTLSGLWAVYTRYKRTVPARPLAAVAALVALAGALVVADLAAVSLVSLLPDVGRGVDSNTRSLFRAGALALVAGQTVLALLAAVGDGDRHVPLALSVPPLAGLAGLLTLSSGRVALVALASGLGLSWLLVGWRLRRVREADVPESPDALAPGRDGSTGGSL